MSLGRHADLIAAMRADHIRAPQDAGLWYIERADLSPNPEQSVILQTAKRFSRQHGRYDDYPTIPPVMTSLCRWTDATLHLGHGEAVMSDDPAELRKHLPVVLQASGRVLVTGLGLGCVVRGLLARPQVEHIDVIEIDADVLSMVAATFNGEPRLTIHHADALAMRWPAGTRWDYAWHDVWGEKPGTQVLHAQLLLKYRRLAHRQGAWGFPRWMKRRWSDPLLDAPRNHAAPEKRRLAL